MMGFMACLLFMWVLVVCLMSKAVDFFSVLIYLEVMVMVVFMGSLFGLSFSGSCLSCYLLVLYLCFGVCEAVVGLSLLVSAARGQAFYSVGSFTVLSL
uniref:NADH dehydrogenase subunit 4L n=1 Tax=Xylophaga washingtona TaxID=1049057 RepID=UPI0020289567|nr:NADH dehydrogenase subunit 4L [Xylophaga washingtona]UPX88944.1 NADH dehydrogenase subunit 4L [Xylophaga washingtona]UPX88956.1 NADH dehydrogenase subunit 4L [Xylophaga washingtona]